MSQDVPTQLFLDQIGNTTVRAILNSTATMPASISPSTLLFSIVEGLDKSQAIFNAENGTIPNVATVSGREVGSIMPTANGGMESQVFYTVGGNISFDVGNAGPIIL